MDEFVVNLVLAHWPFASATLIFMVIGQVMTKNVFTKSAHWTRRPVWFWWWGRKTLPLHPIAAGALLGLLWRNPEVGVDTLAASMGYFAMAGAASVCTYEILKGLAKERGYDLNLPGVDSSNPPPKE